MDTHKNWIHLAEFNQGVHLAFVLSRIRENFRIGFWKFLPFGFFALEIVFLVDLARIAWSFEFSGFFNLLFTILDLCPVLIKNSLLVLCR